MIQHFFSVIKITATTNDTVAKENDVPDNGVMFLSRIKVLWLGKVLYFCKDYSSILLKLCFGCSMQSNLGFNLFTVQQKSPNSPFVNIIMYCCFWLPFRPFLNEQKHLIWLSQRKAYDFLDNRWVLGSLFSIFCT